MAWKNGGPTRTTTPEHKARRTRVLRRDRFRCQIRGPKCLGRATICDHILALALGGTDTDENCQAVCSACHKEKTQQEAAEGRRRWRSRLRRTETRHPGDDPTR